MYDNIKVVCVGTGEIGKPIFELINGVYNALPVDPDHYPLNGDIATSADFLHINIPGNLPNFKDIVIGYIQKYRATYTIIHSTVVPGTTEAICKATDSFVVHSPEFAVRSDN